MALNFNKYPRNWPKVSRIIRRIADGLCERCGQPAHSVHHIGAPLATGNGWRPGKKSDKHDLRRENLISLCFECHDELDNGALSFYARLRARGANKKRKHRALGIGSGLIALKPVRITTFHWQAVTALHYALLRWSKRTGRSQYHNLTQPGARVVDSYIVKELPSAARKGANNDRV